MARYDHDGGCACGLERICDCFHSLSTQEKAAFRLKELEKEAKALLEKEAKALKKVIANGK